MKRIFLMAFAIICSLSGFAQFDENIVVVVPQKVYNHVVSVGPTVGANMTMTSGQPEKYDLFEGTGIGFTGGVAARIRFGRGTGNSEEGTGMFAAGMEVKYTMNKVKTNGKDDLTLGYLDIPLLLQFYPLSGTKTANGLFIEAGPDFALLMTKSPDKLNLPLNQPYPGVQSVEFATGDLKGGDIRVAMGVGYNLGLSNMDLGIRARYYLGMSELSKNVLPTKLNTLELSLSMLFNVAKF